MLDASKAARELSWRPKWNLDEALKRTVAWAKAHKGGADMATHCATEIDAYMD